jgi:predicted RNase H-like HicB family nuclease
MQDVRVVYLGVHTTCRRSHAADNSRPFHCVHVPDVPDVIGTGDTREKAVQEAAHKLAAQLKGMREAGSALPLRSSAKALSMHATRGAESKCGYEVRFCELVEVVEASSIPCLTDADRQTAKAEMMRIWQSLVLDDTDSDATLRREHKRKLHASLDLLPYHVWDDGTPIRKKAAPPIL